VYNKNISEGEGAERMECSVANQLVISVDLQHMTGLYDRVGCVMGAGKVAHLKLPCNDHLFGGSASFPKQRRAQPLSSFFQRWAVQQVFV
jgi:hypothetical protein